MKPKYPDFLNSEHKYNENRFTVVSTFAGCGGSSEGYKMADGKVLLSLDFDKVAAHNYRLNHDSKFLEEDISKISGDKILSLTGLKRYELDILDGSPPCQGFSTAGKTMLNDSRNRLYNEFVRLIDELQPKTFVMENVSGMIKGNMKFLFVEILKDLRSRGYNVKARLMNAANYGVPQKRQRIFFIGVRKDLDLNPVFPEPFGYTYPVKEALEGLNEDDHIEGNKLFKELWDQVKPGQSFDKVHPKGYWWNKTKLDPNKPPPTITKTVMINGGAGLIHWKYKRHLNIDELKRLQSFPDRFKLEGSFKQKWGVIGNSVPPLMIKVIAESIYDNILSSIL